MFLCSLSSTTTSLYLPSTRFVRLFFQLVFLVLLFLIYSNYEEVVGEVKAFHAKVFPPSLPPAPTWNATRWSQTSLWLRQPQWVGTLTHIIMTSNAKGSNLMMFRSNIGIFKMQTSHHFHQSRSGSPASPSADENTKQNNVVALKLPSACLGPLAPCHPSLCLWQAIPGEY